MLAFVDRRPGLKLLAAIGLPSTLGALAGAAWIWRETHGGAPSTGLAIPLALALLAPLVTATYFLAVRYLLERPLERLGAAMRRAEEGDFLVRVPVEGEDLVGELARSFNSTLAAVTDLHARRIEDAQSMESMRRELQLKAQVESQSRLLDVANHRLQESLKELTLVFDLSRTLNSTLELDELLRLITELLGRNLGYDAFALLLLDEARGDLVAKATFGMEAGVEGQRVALGEGAAGWAARERQVLLVRNTLADGGKLRDRWLRDQAGTVLAVPMLCKDECQGVLDLFRPKVDAFPDDEVRLLQSVASQAAMAIANARLHERMVRLSLTDALTGAPNRRSLMARLELELARAERFQHALGLAMIDLDRFKEYNDARGHQAGDAVLKRVAQVLGDSVRKVDLLARYGGEEFALVLPSVSRTEALAAAEKLRAIVAASEVGGPGTRLTVSIGVASYPEDATDLDALFERADAALYEAKKAGRNAVRAWEPEGPRHRLSLRA